MNLKSTGKVSHPRKFLVFGIRLQGYGALDMVLQAGNSVQGKSGALNMVLRVGNSVQGKYGIHYVK
jgi:hypothetical protein